MTVVTSGPKKEGTDASASGRYADVRNSLADDPHHVI
jgi:hypothetical protein